MVCFWPSEIYFSVLFFSVSVMALCLYTAVQTFLGEIGTFWFSTLPTNLEADCVLCFYFRLFFFCLFVSKMSKKNGLAEDGGQTVLGPRISGLDFSADPDLGFPPLGTIMSF